MEMMLSCVKKLIILQKNAFAVPRVGWKTSDQFILVHFSDALRPIVIWHVQQIHKEKSVSAATKTFDFIVTYKHSRLVTYREAARVWENRNVWKNMERKSIQGQRFCLQYHIRRWEVSSYCTTRTEKGFNRAPSSIFHHTHSSVRRGIVFFSMVTYE